MGQHVDAPSRARRTAFFGPLGQMLPGWSVLNEKAAHRQHSPNFIEGQSIPRRHFRWTVLAAIVDPAALVTTASALHAQGGKCC